MAFQDYYRLFGLTTKATANEIRSAYRHLVLKYHPDRNPRDPGAEDTFKQLSAAYRILSDEKERARYDITYLAFQDSQRIRRQNEQAAQTSAQAAPQVQKPETLKKRTEEPPLSVRYRFDSPILQQRDVIWGMAIGFFAALLTGTFSVAAFDATPRATVLAWSALVFPAVFLGQQVGALLEELWGSALEDDFPLWLQGATRFFPSIGVLLALGGTLALYRYFQIPLHVGGALPAAFGAGIASLLGGSLGRAFLSVAESLFGKLVGSSVAILSGFGTALLLSPLFVLAVYGLWFNSQFFDALFTGASGGALGAGVASFLGANRK